MGQGTILSVSSGYSEFRWNSKSDLIKVTSFLKSLRKLPVAFVSMKLTASVDSNYKQSFLLLQATSVCFVSVFKQNELCEILL